MVVSALAFFLRVYRLGDQNVWWDEGWSIWLSQKDLAWIAMRTAMDEHPPLHYWMLHFWNFVAGTNVFAGRFVSVAFGVLTIALLYRIGKRVGGIWVGLLAALFLTTARFDIWWSQDIKNYTPSIFFAFVAVWFALEFRIQNPEVKSQKSQSAIRNLKSAIYYALFAALAMWTHYLAALVLIALNLYLLIVFVRAFQVSGFKFSNWLIGSLVHWLIGNFIAAVLFAPWMYLYLQNAASWSAAPAFDFGVFLQLVATVLPLGVTTNIENYFALTFVLTLLAMLGVVSGQWSVGRKNNSSLTTTHYPLLFALIVVFPPLLVYVLSLTPVAFFAPKIQARYLLVLAPAYAMLLAFGVHVLSRFSRTLSIVAFLVVLGANAFVLNDFYADRRLRDEYTTLANTINSFARQGDLIVLDTDQEWPTFLYYLRYPLDWLGVPNGKPLDTGDADTLTQRALRSNAIWLMTNSDALATDPQKLFETRLARELPKQFERTFDDKRLVLFARDERDLIQVAPENFQPQFLRDVRVNENLQLLGFDLPVREAFAGETIRVVTYWHARVPNTATLNMQPFQIPAGERVRVQTDLRISPEQVGALEINLDALTLGTLTIKPRPTLARVADIANRTDFRLGDSIHLAGYRLPLTHYRPSDTVSPTLFWRTDQSIAKNYTVFVHLVGAQFNPKQNNPLWGQIDRAPSPPMSSWMPGEIVPEMYRVAIDPDAPPGKYQIVIGLYDAATGVRLPTDQGDSVVLAEIEIGR